MKIRLCKRYPKIRKFEKKLSKAFPESTIRIKSCIGMCKQCQAQPVAKVDGVKVKAKKMGEVIRRIAAL